MSYEHLIVEATATGICFIEWVSLVICAHLVQLNATRIKKEKVY